MIYGQKLGKNNINITNNCIHGQKLEPKRHLKHETIKKSMYVELTPKHGFTIFRAQNILHRSLPVNMHNLSSVYEGGRSG